MNCNAKYRKYKMTEVIKCDNDIDKEETDDPENNKKDTEEKFSYKWLQIRKIEDIKNALSMDNISVEENCNSEDSKQPNDKLDDIVNGTNCIDEHIEYVEVHDGVICNNDIVKVETYISEDVKIDPEEHKLNYVCLEIAKTEDMENMFTCDNSSGKADWDSEDSKQLNVKLLDFDGNCRKYDATKGIFIKCVNDNAGGETMEPGNAVTKIEICIENRNANTKDTVKISDAREFMKAISDIKNQNTDPSASKADTEHELSNKFLEPGKIEKVKEEANSDSPLDTVDFDGAVDMEKYAQDRTSNSENSKPTDVTYKDSSEFSNSVRWYRCKFCRYRSKFENRFKKHFANKHKEGPQWYRCHLCEFETVNKQYLKGHFKRKHDDNAEWYKCRLCDLETKQKHYLARHYKTKHYRDSEWHHCEYCAFKTKLEKSLKNHLEFKHDIVREEDKLHHCQFCDYRCKFKSFLRQHLKDKHGQNVEWHEHHCQNCEFKTNVKANLLQHYATLHNQDSVN